MIKAETKVLSKFEHGMECRVETTVDSKKCMLAPELITLIKNCFELEPEITFNAIESVLNEIGDEFIEKGMK